MFKWKKIPRPLLWVWLVSLLVCWGVDFFYFPSGTVFPDESRFLASVRHWLSDGFFISNDGRAWEMPLTSLFFAGICRLTGNQDIVCLYGIRVAQSFLLIVQSWLVWRISRQTFSQPVAALLAASVTALYPFFIFYQGLALSETLFDCLLLAFVAALYTWRDKGCKIDLAMAAAMCLAGLAAYVKGSLTLLPPFLLLVVAWVEGRGTRKILLVLIVGAVFYSATLIPWWLRNYQIFNQFVPFTTSSASNLYLGNNPANLGGGNDWEHDVELEVVYKINALSSELERQAAFGQAAQNFIRQNPQRFFELLVLKFERFWSVVPNAEGYNTGSKAIISAFSFGPVLLLALLGVFVNRRSWRSLLPIYVLIAYFTALHTLTIASLRYRLPLEPFLIILAAGTVSALRRDPASGTNVS